MQQPEFDVAIIGAGPTGAAAALSLPDGVSVAHLDRGGPAREKLCSGLLTEEAQRALAAIFGKYYLPPEVAAPPNINILRYVDFDNGITMTLPVKYASMHRAKFDRWLLSKIKRDGYEPFWGAVVTAVTREDHLFNIEYLEDGEKKSLSARFVVDASGWAAVSRGDNGLARPVRRFAMQAVYPGGGAKEFRAFFHQDHTDWFGWTVPKEDMVLAGIGFAQEPAGHSGNGAGAPAAKAHKRARRAAEKDQTGACDEGVRKKNRLQSFAKFLSMLSAKGWLDIPGLPAPDDIDAIKEFNRIFPVKGSPITTITSVKQVHLGGGGLFAAGEAAGLVSPSSGDGISFGLACGVALGKVFEHMKANGRIRRAATAEEYRIYRDALQPEIRELRFNIQKANMMAHPKLRHSAAIFLAWHKGRKVESLVSSEIAR